jgi:hypothetical protein
LTPAQLSGSVPGVQQKGEQMTKQIVSAKFIYNGKHRVVDNISIDEAQNVLIGFEMRSDGQFSYKIKKFTRDKISNLELIEGLHRSGPVVGRPE